MVQEKLLTVNNLRTEFFSSKKSSVTAINEISFHIDKGEILGLVGESGCGKSVTSLSIMRLLNFTSGKVTKGEVIFEGQDLQQLPEKEMRTIRGGKMSMIFQEPMSSLNPAMRIDKQMIEGIRLHKFAGVGLDVYEEETKNVFEDRSDEILEHSTTARLLSFPNVMITSHQGFFTKEALEAIAETTLQNALDFESGKKSPNQVQ